MQDTNNWQRVDAMQRAEAHQHDSTIPGQEPLSARLPRAKPLPYLLVVSVKRTEEEGEAAAFGAGNIEHDAVTRRKAK